MDYNNKNFDMLSMNCRNKVAIQYLVAGLTETKMCSVPCTTYNDVITLDCNNVINMRE